MCNIWKGQPETPGLKVLAIGNDFLRKGVHYLVEAFKLIDDPGAELWIRGEVPDVYRKRIVDPRVTIIPPVLPERLRRLYETADVFVQPSIDEGFGMTVIEALGYGLPLVITEHVGAKDLLTPDVAVTVPIRDAKAIAAGIEAARLCARPRLRQNPEVDSRAKHLARLRAKDDRKRLCA